MRTTLDLEKPVLDGLKALQRKEKTSLGKIASRLLAEGLSRTAARSQTPPTFCWSSAPMRAKVDLSDKDALHRLMDG